MRTPKIILAFLVLLLLTLSVLFYFSPIGPGSPYRRFHGRDSSYYSRLAHACDSVLSQHPIFTKHPEPIEQGTKFSTLWIDANGIIWDQIKISESDPSLPKAIHALHPDKIYLAPNRVFLGFGESRSAWSITWELDETRTNTWTMQSNAEGWVRKVYTETR
jgi:hypothetical protein